MAQHGYLREYDQSPDRSDDRNDDWRDRDRERAWEGSERDWNERDRGFLFDRNRDRAPDRDDDRGFFDRMGDRARSWFHDDDRYGRQHGFGDFQGDYGRTGRQQQLRVGGRADREPSPRDFSSRQDDHYLSWRERQMDALDRDYADYCREREQQFHSDFDNWRQNRQHDGQSQRSDGTGQTSELELTHERALAEEGNTPSPVGDATLGTNNSENTGRGRR